MLHEPNGPFNHSPTPSIPPPSSSGAACSDFLIPPRRAFWHLIPLTLTALKNVQCQFAHILTYHYLPSKSMTTSGIMELAHIGDLNFDKRDLMKESSISGHDPLQSFMHNRLRHLHVTGVKKSEVLRVVHPSDPHIVSCRTPMHTSNRSQRADFHRRPISNPSPLMGIDRRSHAPLRGAPHKAVMSTVAGAMELVRSNTTRACPSAPIIETKGSRSAQWRY
jgi:hypothetical protein